MTSMLDIEAAIHKVVEVNRLEPKVLMIINLGNLTGALLNKLTMHRVVCLYKQHGLILLTDEVYQLNLHVHEMHPFTSFKKVIHVLGLSSPFTPSPRASAAGMVATLSAPTSLMTSSHSSIRWSLLASACPSVTRSVSTLWSTRHAPAMPAMHPGSPRQT
jgi:hypothetical protein